MNKNNKTQPVKNKYKVKLIIGNNFYDENKTEIKAEGDTLVEALSNLESPELIKSPGILEVEYDKFTTIRPMNILKIKQLFNPKTFYKDIMAKNIMLFLK